MAHSLLVHIAQPPIVVDGPDSFEVFALKAVELTAGRALTL